MVAKGRKSKARIKPKAMNPKPYVIRTDIMQNVMYPEPMVYGGRIYEINISVIDDGTHFYYF